MRPATLWHNAATEAAVVGVAAVIVAANEAAVAAGVVHLVEAAVAAADRLVVAAVVKRDPLVAVVAEDSL